MYKNILVPLDGSRRAEAILPHVIELAQNQGATLTLLTVVEPLLSTINPCAGASATFDVEAFSKQTEASEAYITELARDLTIRGVKSDIVIEHGHVVNTIINVAENRGVDLIAIASHGRTGMSRALYGSVAAALLYQVERPLLLIRAASEPT